MHLYESSAAFATQPGSLAHGLSGVREALGGFISMNGTLALEVTRVLEVDDLASRRRRVVIRRHWPGRQPGAAGRKERGRPASSGRRHLALRDRQPLGNRLSRPGRARGWPASTGQDG